MKYFFPNKLFGHTLLTIYLDIGISENLFHSDFQAANQAGRNQPKKKISKSSTSKAQFEMLCRNTRLSIQYSRY